MMLADLPADTLRELFGHVEHPFMPKLACRAFRDAAPKKTRTPARAFVTSIAILRWARAMMGAAQFRSMGNILSSIAATGELDVFIWARAHAANWNNDEFALACGSGSQPMVEWIMQRRGRFLDFPHGRRGCAAAAANNHLDLLKWLASDARAPKGRFEDGTITTRKFAMDGTSAVAAAENGHLEVLKWVCETLGPVDWAGHRKATYEAAGRNGHIDVLRWLVIVREGEELDLMLHVHAVGSMVAGNQLACLDWAKRNLAFPNNFMDVCLEHATDSGIMDWALKNGHPLTARSAQTAIRSCRLSTAEWLEAQGHKWNQDDRRLAFTNRDQTVFKWMYAKRGRSAQHSAEDAIYALRSACTGNLEMLKLTFPVSYSTDALAEMRAYAHENGHDHCVHWLDAQVSV